MGNDKGRILYVGGFELPDKNAAAQRVVSIAKALREQGYIVDFINQTADNSKGIITEEVLFGFTCFQMHKDNSMIGLIKRMFGIGFIKRVILNKSDYSAVIAYNYPAPALNRLNRFCKKNGIKCIGDTTEWYVSNDRLLPLRMIRNFDSNYRMKIVNKRLDGLIVISDYLYRYYENILPEVNVPPLVDKQERKWEKRTVESHEGIELIYAGSPSKTKERLDYIVNTVKRVPGIKLRVIGITRDQFTQIYSDTGTENERVFFMGRIPHSEVINYLKGADYSIIMRDDNLVNRAGFPTKFVESISSGTPVITNDNSCTRKYIDSNKNGLLIDMGDLQTTLETISKDTTAIEVEDDTFDYRNYSEIISCFFETKI